MAAPNSFVLGVNYWPRTKAMYWWKLFDRAEVEREFAEIAALRLEVVRIFLLWEDFQPAPDDVSERALDNLGAVLDVARGLGLKVMPTLFTGHMSGVNWWPAWALSDAEEPAGRLRVASGSYTARQGRDPYTDPQMLEAEHLLAEAVCGRYGAHPAVFAWDLANEPDLFYLPRQYDDTVSWTATLSATVRRHSALPVTVGMHLPSLTRYNGFRPDLLSSSVDFHSMHAYSIYYPPVEQDDPLNSDIVPLACLVTEALGRKPVLLAETGYAGSESGEKSERRRVRRGGAERRQYFADNVSGARYYSEVLTKLARCGAIGLFAWMFSDYDPALWGMPPLEHHVHERFFGITRYDGSPKPSATALRAFADQRDASWLPPRTVGPLHLDGATWYQDPGAAFEQLRHEWEGRL